MFTKLLIPLDRSLVAEQAIARAAALAQQCNAQLDIVLVHEPIPAASADAELWRVRGLQIEEAYVEHVASKLAMDAKLSVTSAVMHGQPAEMIRERAKNVGADLIVMTTHGRTGLSRAWLGSVADAVMRQATIPVLMLRPTEGSDEKQPPPESFRHVLVPLDGSAVAADILTAATDLARANGADVTLLRVVPPVPILMPMDPAMPLALGPTIPDQAATDTLVDALQTQLTETGRRLREETDLAVATHVSLSERTAETIVEFAEEHGADVIAMSTQGRGASRLLLGSVVDKVLRSCDLPMLLRRSTRTGRSSGQSTDDATEPLPALAIP